MIPLRVAAEAFGKYISWEPLVPPAPNQIGSVIRIKMPPSIEQLLII